MPRCKILVLTLFLIGTVVQQTLGADAPLEISLWPKGAPGASTGPVGNNDAPRKSGNLVAGKSFSRLNRVNNPSITVYRPAPGRANGTAVMVCPGGGYNFLTIDLTGTEICEWLNSLGVTAVLLQYRVPAVTGAERYSAPLQDAQRALGLVRQRAKEWDVDPKRIGIIGFSAGGHLAANLSNHSAQRVYEPQDEADAASCRPDFALLIYPAYLTPKDDRTKLAPEITVTKDTPPSFLVQTDDDGVGVENSLVYAAALQAAHVPLELHIYPKGGHGYGLRPTELPVTTWPKRAEEWLGARGLLKAN